MDTSLEQGEASARAINPSSHEREEDVAPAARISDEKTGYISRFENFETLKAKAASFSGTEYNKALMAAAARSIRGLTPSAKLLLLEAIDMTDKERYKTADAGIIWARNKVFAERLGIHLDTIKAAKRELERKGLAIRHAADDNNATRLDIRPFLVDVDGHMDYRFAIDDARRLKDQVGDSFPTLEQISPPQGGRTPTHIQSFPTTSRESVRSTPNGSDDHAESASTADRSFEEDKADATRTSPFDRRPEGDDTAGTPKQYRNRRASVGTVICSARRASGSFGGNSPGNVAAESPRGALLAAWELSGRWQAEVSRATVEKLAYDDLFASGWELIRQNFPEESRNHHHTWEWAVKRYHWRALIMVVVAIEDPSVRKPHSYFGWLALKAEGIDLADNLALIQWHRDQQQRRLDDEDDGAGGHEPAETSMTNAETAAAPAEWDKFREALRAAVSPVEFRCWLDPLAFVGINAGQLVLSAPTRFLAQSAENRAGPIIVQVARAIGWKVHLLDIRSPS